ncbi:MAG: putative manganese-dependent inorganic diphosphatase, partial [Desulfuromonadaceae bacterium]|nr:putative manganese-dependent inorganic diphosphatase [Desulfuromonadaceae bacterium]
MIKSTYVIGHRNPDTDSIASAISYAALKQELGDKTAIAAMAGAPNPQTRYILDRLEITDPLFLADVHPKVRDTIKREPITVGRQASAYEALELFNKSGVRVLPVVDDDNKPCGILSLLRLSESYLLPCHDKIRGVTTTLTNLARTLSGSFVDENRKYEDSLITLNLFIGAMLEDSFNSMISGFEPQELLIMTGNRRTIQLAAIERGVRVLVVTGGHKLEESLVDLARARGVAVLRTPHDTATAAWLARLSTPAVCLAEPEFVGIGVNKSLVALRQKLLGSNVSAVLALEGDNTLAGVATKSSLLAPLPCRLILMDHNELGQAVPGAELVEITEVIDHHTL